MMKITYEEMKPIFDNDKKLRGMSDDNGRLGQCGELIVERFAKRNGIGVEVSADFYDSKKDMTFITEDGSRLLVEVKTGAPHVSKKLNTFKDSQFTKLSTVDLVVIIMLNPHLVWKNYQNFRLADGTLGPGKVFALEKDKFKIYHDMPEKGKCSIPFSELGEPFAELDAPLQKYLQRFVSAAG